MRAHELFKNMSDETAAEIFTFLHRDDKPAYKATIQGLANQRNLRSVFVERKPPNERFPWMKNALSRPISDTLATHLLQAWLLRAHKPMLNDFLDSLEIAHEEDGTVEDLPASPPKEKLQAAVDHLLGKYPAQTVAIYLHAFRDMDSTMRWPALDEMLSDDARLQFAK
ncbi:MAG TPA: hypothetical protein VGC85_09245 [Chthoniobacterales bacterium]|jgi:hypothetical protein